MEINNVEIDDAFAECFTGTYSRLIITAVSEKWAKIAAECSAGYGTSMIGCSAEAGIEGFLNGTKTPDGRPGYIVQLWTSKKRMMNELIGRIGQCVLTAPTTAVFNHCDSDEMLDAGHKLKYFGDGFEDTGTVGDRKVTIIPVMGGDFIIEKEFGVAEGVAGGNFIILANSIESALKSAEAAIDEIDKVPGVIAPFPGGICASGSKVGSNKYSFMHACTNERYCPTICDRVDNSLVKDAGGAFEIVIDGTSEDRVKEAMKKGIIASCQIDGVQKISAGSYGGALGNVHIYLRELF